tara:strand:+ start:155 stop:838 length:684 start_codon:yes stop_codon:yes gene_type:complete
VDSNKEIFSSKPSQIAKAAIDVSKIIFGDLTNKKMIIIGDSNLPFSIGKNLKNNQINVFEKKLKDIFYYIEKKTKFIKNLESFLNHMSKYDIFLIGFKSEYKIFNCQVAKKILEKRKYKPIFLIDCGVPGNIEQDISKINNCFLYDLNDLEQFFSIDKGKLNVNSNAKFDEDFINEKINNYLANFIKKMDLNSTQVSVFEKYLRLFFIKANNQEEKKSILNFLNLFK